MLWEWLERNMYDLVEVNHSMYITLLLPKKECHNMHAYLLTAFYVRNRLIGQQPVTTYSE